MLDSYFDRTEDGKTTLRPEVHDQFFDDLHETMQNQLFEGQGTVYEYGENNTTIEVRLPEASELIRYIQMRVRKDGIEIVADFPATVFPDAEEQSYSMNLLYNPPEPTNKEN